ncbi:hypothetical protein BC940DRAFT_276770 [Gongronella butleri]|nr:hypothetical protein BC940DRAFT_276770 [Gongronella butleri]
MSKRSHAETEEGDVHASEDILHPRNKYYNNPPDFEVLALDYPSFRPLQLTVCLLKRDFDLTVDLPLTRLIPPIPNRLNYILWIEDLLMETLDNADTRRVHGIDIGVGASCIYPLLGCQTNANWDFLGTEIDEDSLHYAQRNVSANQLDARISLVLNNDPYRIFLLDDRVRTYDFCMCNPPFFASEEEVREGEINKELEPSAVRNHRKIGEKKEPFDAFPPPFFFWQVCTGSTSEMITDGGEVAFIRRMILESLRYRERIRWYSSMIGLKRSIRPITQMLKEHKINNYVVTEFCQGRTKRWGIAWSFRSARVVKARSLESYRPKTQFETDLPISLEVAEAQLLSILQDLCIVVPSGQFSVEEHAHGAPGKRLALEIRPTKNTWARAARRLLKRQRVAAKDDPSQQGEPSDSTTALASLPSISLAVELTLMARKHDSHCTLQASWLHGQDRDVFESFWNHLKKRMEDAAGIGQGSAFKG